MDHRHKRGAILASILGSVASKVIGLAYEGISSLLHHKRHKALNKAVAVIDKKTNIQCKQIHHLEDAMIMYGIYISDTLTDLVDTVHRMQNFTTWNEVVYIWNRQQKEFDCRIPCICAALHQEEIDYVPN